MFYEVHSISYILCPRARQNSSMISLSVYCLWYISSCTLYNMYTVCRTGTCGVVDARDAQGARPNRYLSISKSEVDHPGVWYKFVFLFTRVSASNSSFPSPGRLVQIRFFLDSKISQSAPVGSSTPVTRRARGPIGTARSGRDT